MKRLIVVLWIAWTIPVQAENLTVSLSRDKIAIGSNYSGADIVVFGTVERDAQTVSRAGGYDLVVTVQGPRQGLVVRRKERAGPLWINRAQQKFVDVPAYIGVLSSKPLNEALSPASRTRLRLGLDAIVNAPDFTFDRGTDDDPFRDALLRIKKREGLYVENAHGAQWLTPALFKASLKLPALAPPGRYGVETLLFVDDTLLARRTSSFEVEKTGFEQKVADWARDASWLYGLATALLALACGWLASVVFRRD